VTRQPATSFPISFQLPFNRAGGRTSNVLPEMKPVATLLIGALSLLSCTDQSSKMTNEPAEFLYGYGGQTTEELIGMASDYRIDSIVLSFEEALDQRKAHRNLKEEESWILAIVALEREVNNGGYLQFLNNSSREHAPIVVRALEAISCPQVADLTARAIAALNIQGEITESAIESAIEAREEKISERFDMLDSEYYRQTENIEYRLFEFIKANKSRIKVES
jgi:hypothetical protein